MRGRKPDSPDLQAAKGSPGRRARSPAKPVQPVKPGAISAPKWLGRSRKAMEVWRQYIPLLERMNLATELDAQPLGRYCRYVVEWVAADEAIRKEGTWYDTVDTNGQATKKRHPAFHAWRELEKSLTDLEASFGMRPDSRFKILRDQAASLGGLPLFGGNHADKPSEPAAADAPPDEDPIGALSRLDGPPPGVRPN